MKPIEEYYSDDEKRCASILAMSAGRYRVMMRDSNSNISVESDFLSLQEAENYAEDYVMEVR